MINDPPTQHSSVVTFCLSLIKLEACIPSFNFRKFKYSFQSKSGFKSWVSLNECMLNLRKQPTAPTDKTCRKESKTSRYLLLFTHFFTSKIIELIFCVQDPVPNS